MYFWLLFFWLLYVDFWFVVDDKVGLFVVLAGCG